LPIEGAAEIEYNTKREHVNVYARGSKPVAMGRGKTEFSGKLTLLQSEVESLQKSLPAGKNLTDMAPFNITVAFAPEGGVIVVDQLIKCRFMEVPKGMKTGDTHKEIEMPLAIGDIQYNV